MTHKEILLYGFAETDRFENLGPIGIDRQEAHLAPQGNIAALISPFPAVSFDTLPKETLLRNLTVYQAVIETAMKTHPVVPVKFGTVLYGKKVLEPLLKGNHHRIAEALRRFRNRLELNLVALWHDLETILKEIGEQPEILALKADYRPGSDAEAVGLKVKIGKEVKACLDRRTRGSARRILRDLKEVTEDHREHALMDETMILNAAFLLQEEKANEFERRVEQLDHHFQGRVDFRVIGPLPAYSFQTLEVSAADYDAVERARRLLELGEKATLMEVRENYRILTKRFHPDRRPGEPGAEQRFKEINEAYNLLSAYCRECGGSFKRSDIQAWITVRPVEYQDFR